MNTHIHEVSPEVHELYIAKINTFIADGREALISSVVADYDELSDPKPADQAA
jgi:hypothetical protein